jgi:glycosyltransferase involved in cell wall biosynthesis
MQSRKRDGGKPKGQVTAIIPAYNEADHIGTVLQLVAEQDDVSQIIVVDDCSRDGTAAAVQAQIELNSHIELIRLAKNSGKGRALLSGTEARENDLLLFLDADLLQLRSHHLTALIDPVRSCAYAMTLGIFQEGRWATDFTHRYLPFLSGQRCLRWPLFNNVFNIQETGWSIETAFNLHAWYHHYPILRVPWKGVSHVTRIEKYEGLSGNWSHLKMWLDIARYTVRFFAHHPRRTGRHPYYLTPDT